MATVEGIVRRYYEAFNTRNEGAYADLFAPDCVTEAPGFSAQGVEGVRAFDRVWTQAFPKARIEVLRTTTVGDHLATANWLHGGKQEGPLRGAAGEIPATGAEFSAPYAASFLVRDGRIALQRLQFDGPMIPVMLGLGTARSEPDNVAFVADLYEAFKRGDVPYIVSRFGDLQSSGVVADAKKRAPWHAPMVGEGAVAKYFDALIGTMEPLRLDVVQLAAQGEYVYATLTQEWKVRATGKVLTMKDGVHRFRIRGGKVVEWRGFEDTALTCEALGI
jgi:ketosteroid isomerase-like protein